MVTTGAAPTAAVIKEELKNHPEKAMQMGITGAALGALSSPLSSLVPVSYTHLEVYKRQQGGRAAL